MEGFLATLDWPTAASTSAFAFGVAFAIVAQTYEHVRQAFHRWRLDRRLARDPYILREEMIEYNRAIGGELEPVTLSEVLGSSLAVGLVFGFGAWLLDNELDQWWDIGEAALFGGALLLALWRWLNDPRDLLKGAQADEETGELSGEGGIGLADAVAMVLLIMFGIFWFF